MSTKQREQLNIQGNVESPDNSNSSTEITFRENLPGTPYWVVGNKEKGYILTFMKWQLTDKMKTPLDIELYLEANKYDIILKTIICIIEVNNTEKVAKMTEKPTT